MTIIITTDTSHPRANHQLAAQLTSQVSTTELICRTSLSRGMGNAPGLAVRERIIWVPAVIWLRGQLVMGDGAVRLIFAGLSFSMSTWLSTPAAACS